MITTGFYNMMYVTLVLGKACLKTSKDLKQTCFVRTSIGTPLATDGFIGIQW